MCLRKLKIKIKRKKNNFFMNILKILVEFMKFLL